jgi:hypothetical protein
MNEGYLNHVIAQANKRRSENQDKLRRHVELGYIKGEIRPDSVFLTRSPKGIQNWYDTRTLIRLVSERMDMMEAAFGQRYCPINGKWQLQIRGKHKRRLLKAKPEWKQFGRKIVEEK